MKQFTDSVTTQAATLAALSTKTNSSGGSGQKIDKTKAIPGLHVCAQCKRGVYHKGVNCFIITCTSFSYLLAPPLVTALAAKSVASVRMVWPSTLASISLMHLACALAFYSSAAEYSISNVKLSSAVVAVAPMWDVSRVWGWGAYWKAALLSKFLCACSRSSLRRSLAY